MMSGEAGRGLTGHGRDQKHGDGAERRQFYGESHGGNVLEHGEASFLLFIGGLITALIVGLRSAETQA
jgi:hypothetical protein